MPPDRDDLRAPGDHFLSVWSMFLPKLVNCPGRIRAGGQSASGERRRASSVSCLPVAGFAISGRNPDTAAVLQPLKDRAERIQKDLEERKTTGLAALAAEKEAAMKSARESGLSARAFGVFWSLRDDATMKASGIDPMTVAAEADRLMVRFPNAALNSEERRRLRAALYPLVLKLDNEDRARVVGTAMAHLVPEEEA